MKTSPSLGIALGGGGARGAAHIGVLQEMSLAGIEFDIISGVSSGSVIAAMYAYSKDPLWIEKKMRKSLIENKDGSFLIQRPPNRGLDPWMWNPKDYI